MFTINSQNNAWFVHNYWINKLFTISLLIRSQLLMLQFIYIWTLESFTIKELIICLQFISCLVIIRNNTYKYTMLLSDVENVTAYNRCLHKRWYIVSNAYKLISSINIYPSPENASSGLLGACNNCRTTWNYISLIFGRAVTEKLVMTLHIFHAYTFRIFIPDFSNFSLW